MIVHVPHVIGKKDRIQVFQVKHHVGRPVLIVPICHVDLSRVLKCEAYFMNGTEIECDFLFLDGEGGDGRYVLTDSSILATVSPVVGTGEFFAGRIETNVTPGGNVCHSLVPIERIVPMRELEDILK